MLSKVIIYLTFLITLTFSAKIMSKLEDGTSESAEIITNIEVTPTNIPDELEILNSLGDISMETIKQISAYNAQMNDNNQMGIQRKGKPSNTLKFSILTNGNKLQLLESIDRIRSIDNEDNDVGLLLIDPHTPPQTQLVDNTLRLMAIKSSLDDLALKIFPNHRMLKRVTLDHH